MADVKISALPSSTVPLAGTELVPIVQGGVTKNVTVNNLTAGKSVSASALDVSANSASAAVTITQAGAGNALVVEDSTRPDSTPFVIDTDGNVIKGATSRTVTSANNLTVTNQFLGAGDPSGNLGIFRWDTTAASSPALVMSRAQGTTLGTNTVVNSGDRLGLISFGGADGTNFIEAANIQVYVDGTPGTNDMPGRLVFTTTADGASTATERMRITNAGQFLFGTTSSTTGNAVFGASQSAAQYNVSISGTNTTANATVGAFNINSPITGTAATTAMRGISNITNWVPNASSSVGNVYGIFNQTALAGTVTPTNYHSVWSAIQLTSAATGGTITSSYSYNAGVPVFDAAATTNITNHYQYYAGTITNGAAQTITNGFGFYSNVASGTGRWNFYANGTADNYFAGAVMQGQPAPATFAAAGTLTVTNAVTRIIITSGTTYSLTLDTGTNWETGFSSWPTNGAIDFSVINTASGTVTIATAAGWTLTGTMTIAPGVSAQFRARKTAANTFTLYRFA